MTAWITMARLRNMRPATTSTRRIAGDLARIRRTGASSMITAPMLWIRAACLASLVRVESGL